MAEQTVFYAQKMCAGKGQHKAVRSVSSLAITLTISSVLNKNVDAGKTQKAAMKFVEPPIMIQAATDVFINENRLMSPTKKIVSSYGEKKLPRAKSEEDHYGPATFVISDLGSFGNDADSSKFNKKRRLRWGKKKNEKPNSSNGSVGGDSRNCTFDDKSIDKSWKTPSSLKIYRKQNDNAPSLKDSRSKPDSFTKSCS